MTSQVPKVSIGLPVYNGENYLREALESILQQDYADFELIISDNASTDATQTICLEYAARDCRVRYHRNEFNIGASGNHNRLVKLARGQYFKWGSHDDVHLPGFLRRCVEVIEQAPPTVALVATKAEVIDENGNHMNLAVETLDTRRQRSYQRGEDVLRNVQWATALYGLFRIDVLRKTHLTQPFYAADNVLLFEIALLGEIWELPEALFQRRLHPGVSTVANKSWRALHSWFDPSQRGIQAFFPPTLRIAFAFFGAITKLPMPMRDRLLCYLTVVKVWGPRESRRLFKKVRSSIALRTRLNRLFSGLFDKAL